MKKNGGRFANRRGRVQSACPEMMEPRLLLSRSPASVNRADSSPVAHLTGIVIPGPAKPTATKIASKGKVKKSTAAPAGYGVASPYGGITPAQMQGTYLGTNFNFNGITGDGSGQTIALVDAYDDPGLVNSTATNFATSDLAEFDAYYHLPNPVFTKYGVNSNTVTTSLPATTGTPYYSSGIFTWEIEESLDVEWAHVMAPKANIVLIEANTSSLNNFLHAVVAAEQLPGVSVVSMSFSADEDTVPNQGLFDADLDNASGITFLASAGDDGAYSDTSSTTIEPQYPADSPYVVAVGGTSLTVSGTSWLSETTWGHNTSSGTAGSGGGSGGGVSGDETIPSYQTGLLGSTGNRQYPDISLDGNPTTGVPVYDSYDFGSTTPWVYGTIGGTSLASPLMAGLVAVADQGRALDKLAPLNSNGLSGGIDIHTLLYSLAGSSNSYAADFHDITTGNATGPAGPAPTGYSPEPGFDLASGLGTPVTGRLVFDLSGISSTLAINQPAITSIYFKLDSNNTYTDIWVNAASPGTGTPTYQFLTADISSYSVTNGNTAITFANIPAASLTIGTGTDSLTVNGGVVTVTPQTPGGGILTRNFSSISIASGASLIFSTAPLHTDRTLVESNSLAVLGQMDLGGNDMIIHTGNLTAITALLATGYASGQWNGQGIASSAAHSDTAHITALGVIQNTLYGGTGQPTFDNASPLATDVLIKFTYYGDTNLDGKVDGTDYARIDNAYLFGGTGWYNGDFNYDNHVNGSDYTLMDNAFNMQGLPS